MLAGLMAGAGWTGAGGESPLKWMAALLAGEPGLIMAGQAQGGSSTAIVLIMGLVIHFATAIALARLFQALTGGVRWTGRGLLGGGLLYGVAVWAVARFAALPLFDRVMFARVQLVPWTFLAAHLFYGAALAGFALMSASTHAHPSGGSRSVQ